MGGTGDWRYCAALSSPQSSWDAITATDMKAWAKASHSASPKPSEEQTCRKSSGCCTRRRSSACIANGELGSKVYREPPNWGASNWRALESFKLGALESPLREIMM